MKNQIIIEKFLNGMLSPKEQIQFDMLMQKDSDFAKEVSFQKSLKNAVTEFEDEQFKKKLIDFENNKSIQLNHSKLWMIAASIAVLMIIGSIFIFYTPNNEKIFAQNFEPYPNVVHPIVRGETSEEEITLVFLAYNSKQYAEAILGFENIYNTEQLPFALFYGGLSELASGNTAEGKELLQKYLSTEDTQFSIETKWYLALAHIKEDKPKEAIVLFEEVALSTSEYAQTAHEILQQLK